MIFLILPKDANGEVMLERYAKANPDTEADQGGLLIHAPDALTALRAVAGERYSEADPISWRLWDSVSARYI